MLKGIEIRTETDYFQHKTELNSIASKIVFTGIIDEFYNYQFGNLEYRSLEFKNTILDIDNYQGNAVVNYTEADVPFTRIIEHKHFQFGTQKRTIITHEYSKESKAGDEPFYPINDDKNNLIYNKYKELAMKEPNIIFGGRLAEYKYYDMHHIVEKVLSIEF